MSRIAAKSMRPFRGILSTRQRARLGLEGMRRQKLHAEALRRKRLGID